MLLFAVAVAVAVAAAAPAAQVHIVQSGLVAPGMPSDQRVGSLADADVQLGPWVTKTRVAIVRKGRVFDVTADIDLANVGTEVVVGVGRAVRLSGTGPWVMGLLPEARIPLIAGDDAGLDLGFLRQQSAPVTTARLDTAAATTFTVAGKPEPCLVSVLHAAADDGAASFAPASFVWSMFATSTPANGWHAVQARGNGMVVDAFAHDRDVHCDVGSGGGFATRGTGAGGGDGTMMAREATLPKETRFFADAARTVPVAVVHRAVRALQAENGSWRVPALSDRGRSTC